MLVFKHVVALCRHNRSGNNNTLNLLKLLKSAREMAYRMRRQQSPQVSRWIWLTSSILYVHVLTFTVRLSDAGLQYIEVSSFVRPSWVPQLVDATEVFQKIRRRVDCTYAALVPNTVGMTTAIGAKPDEVAVFTAASESFCKRNTNCTIEESIARFQEVLLSPFVYG